MTGVVNVAKACLEAKVPRLVVVSSGGVATPDSSIYKFLNLFGEVRVFFLESYVTANYQQLLARLLQRGWPVSALSFPSIPKTPPKKC